MQKKEISAVYLAGLIQGVTLVAFPAASTLFTDPKDFNFTSSQYGSLFISDCILSIAASYFSPKLSKKWGAKNVFLLGLFANFLSMLLLALSALIMHETDIVYSTLVVAMALLGIGFGFTVPTINTMAALLRPDKVDSVILVLNALLGVGTALAPIFISIFITLGFWWGLPLLMVILLFLLMLFSFPLQFPGKKLLKGEIAHTASIPKRLGIFLTFALVYGIIETLNGNWASIYMKDIQGVSVETQTLALTLFWVAVTFGRVFFALLSRYLNEDAVFQILPFIAAASFVLIYLLSAGNENLSLFAFALAGFGCSALLPFVISFGSRQLKSISGAVAGYVIAFYLLGYGISAFGVGAVLDSTSWSLSDVYALGALLSVFLGAVAFVINKGENYGIKEEV